MARISINKLAELLTSANPARRRKIIQDQKYPNTNIVARYRNAYEPIGTFLANGRQESTITSAITRLQNEAEGSKWVLDDRWNTADALERFLDVAGALPEADGEQYQPGESNPQKLNIAGVDISIRPDFVIGFTKRGNKYTGAVKLHFIKNAESALTRGGAEYVATLLKQWLDEYGPDGAAALHSHCLCIDVFRGVAVSAPKSTTRRMSEVTAACEEIAARWPQL